MPTKANASASKPSGKAAAPTNFSKFESSILANATAGSSERGIPSRLSPNFLNTIKEVVARKSQYRDDSCYARILFKDGKHKCVPLDYEVLAEPGDKLRLSSLQWLPITTSDGESLTVLTGVVI